MLVLSIRHVAYERKILLKPQKNSDLQNWQIKALQMPYFSVFYEQN